MLDAQRRVGLTAQTLWALAATRVVRPYWPDRVFGTARTLVHWGAGFVGGYTALAARMPDATGLIDETGSLTFDELHTRTNALAHGLDGMGVREGDSVALMARPQRGLVEAAVAVAKLGADVLHLDPDLSADSLPRVLEREQPALVVCDEEFAALLEAVPDEVPRVVAWVDAPAAGRCFDALPTLEQLIAANDDVDVRRPARESRNVLLTAGSSGEPRGASRGSGTLEAAAAVVSRLPLRYGWSVHVAAPLFHSWGWAHLNLSMLVDSTLVLRRHFDPEDFLRTLADHGSQATVTAPVMLQRVLDLPDGVLARHDVSHLQVVAVSGAALPGRLSTRWMDRFGDHLYKVHGLTECAWATIAKPAELRGAPGTAGREPIGTVVLPAR